MIQEMIIVKAKSMLFAAALADDPDFTRAHQRTIQNCNDNSFAIITKREDESRYHIEEIDTQGEILVHIAQKTAERAAMGSIVSVSSETPKTVAGAIRLFRTQFNNEVNGFDYCDLVINECRGPITIVQYNTISR